MKRVFIIAFALSALLLAGCDIFEPVNHHNAHIGGYIGEADEKIESVSGLEGYTNVCDQFYAQHPEFRQFIKRYIFESWGSDGPRGQAQFYQYSDWMSEKRPGDDGKMEEFPFTKNIVVSNGYFGLENISWQQPWKSWKWKIVSASSKEIVLANSDDKLFFKLDNVGSIKAEGGYDEKTEKEKYY